MGRHPDVGARRGHARRKVLPTGDRSFSVPRESIPLQERRRRLRKVIVSEFVSLDGMEAPGGADEDTEGGFQHGWTR